MVSDARVRFFLGGWMEEKTKKRPDGSIHTYHPRAMIATQSSAARVALRWVGFFGSVGIFFSPQVLLNAGVHISSLEIFL